MKRAYDFGTGQRGAIDRPSPGKTRITIRLDNEIIEWFRSQVEAKGGGNYQTMINEALKEYIRNPGAEIRDTVRNTLEEYLHRHRVTVEPARHDIEESAKKT
jgi:metal-responsive CopG/Arc/MetJ family transcriptional regulator